MTRKIILRAKSKRTHKPNLRRLLSSQRFWWQLITLKVSASTRSYNSTVQTISKMVSTMMLSTCRVMRWKRSLPIFLKTISTVTPIELPTLYPKSRLSDITWGISRQLRTMFSKRTQTKMVLPKPPSPRMKNLTRPKSEFTWKWESNSQILKV